MNFFGSSTRYFDDWDDRTISSLDIIFVDVVIQPHGHYIIIYVYTYNYRYNHVYELGTTPRFKLINPNHAWKRFNHERKTQILNHDLVCLGSTILYNQISLVNLFWVSFGSF